MEEMDQNSTVRLIFIEDSYIKKTLKLLIDGYNLVIYKRLEKKIKTVCTKNSIMIYGSYLQTRRKKRDKKLISHNYQNMFLLVIRATSPRFLKNLQNQKLKISLE